MKRLIPMIGGSKRFIRSVASGDPLCGSTLSVERPVGTYIQITSNAL